ncbi:MAG: NlpC/P60 family protein [Solirubrobacteraceae bacterium]
MSDSGQAQAARPLGGKPPRAWMVAAVAVLAVAVALALVLGLKGGDSHPAGVARAAGASARTAKAASAHAIAPAAAPATGSPAAQNQAAPATGAKRTNVSEVADPEEANSFPSPASVHHKAAATPSKASEQVVAAGAPSDAEVKKELAQMQAVERSAKQQQQAQLKPVQGGNGTIPIPTNVPEVVQRVIAGANAITNFPYVFGGGHGSFVDNAYDCSGSVSYALAAGGLLSAPETSGELESWGAPGPGRYITVMAAAGHTYMYVDGVLYDTAGRSGPYASRWQVSPTDNSGYVVRHWPGL